MSSHQIHNDEFSIKVNSFGAELCSVSSKKNKLEYIWQAQKDLWPRYAPNLFPIVGKLKEGNYSFQNNIYQLPQHGFARDSEFTCVEKKDDTLIFELKSSEETLKHYPFDFTFQIIYTLLENRLITEYKIYNPTQSLLYFSVGAHPAFNCPLQKNELFEDYILEFPDINTLEINELNNGLIKSNTKNIFLKKNKLNISTSLFENDALVLTNYQINKIRLVSSKSKHGVEMNCKNWPYFGIWTKKNSEKFICLEPWHGIADFETSSQKLKEKEGIIELKPEQHFNCSFEILFF